jgi:hypothetical protein
MRRDGKTTKLIDKAIQTLFTEGKICVPSTDNVITVRKIVKGTVATFIDPDHNENNSAQDDFLHRLKRRLSIEHYNCFLIKDSIITTLITQYK